MTPQRLRALIADDTAVALAAVVRRLRSAGVTCVEASSAANASAVDPHTIGCALLDLDLGDGTGVDVAAVLLAKRPDLPIAFFTAGASQELQERARKLAPVYVKPDDMDEVVRWLVKHTQP